MPAILDRCVTKVMAQGKSKSRAYGICVASTGWQKAKGGGWTRRGKGGSAVGKQALKSRKE
ncbi:MAG: hypothetical protein KAX30_04275 [Candidatus Atribacteria bacterium]|nr:hypothetical protein [Candidatus Atribacteria bacterium]